MHGIGNILKALYLQSGTAAQILFLITCRIVPLGNVLISSNTVMLKAKYLSLQFVYFTQGCWHFPKLETWKNPNLLNAFIP